MAATAVMLLLAGCTSGGSGAGGSAGTPAANEGKPACGAGTGKKAAGTPIKLGAIVTNQPGVDFTQIPNAAKAFFDCVNDNGGINGHPIDYHVEQDQTDPQQVASLATKLIEDEGVLAMVGSADLLDCTVNADYYAKKGFKTIVAGVPPECFRSPSFGPLNQGPYFASIAASQKLVKDGAKSVIVVTADTPGGEFANSGAIEYAQGKGLKTASLLETVPITDAAGLALRLADQAGDGGGVLVNFSPPELIKLFTAIQQQGLIDRVKWSCVSCIDASIASSLTADWNGKLRAIDEFALTNGNDADTKLYRQVTQTYSPDIPLGNFGQMGFLSAKIITDILLTLPEDQLTPAGVNKAIQDTKPIKSDMLCTPYYYGNLDVHVPNNNGRVVGIKDGGYVPGDQDCFPIAALASNPLAQIRDYEKAQGISK